MMARPKQIRSDGQLSSLAGPRESSTLRPSDRLVTAAVRKQQERGGVQPGMEKQDVISAHGVPHDGDSDGSDTDSSLDDEHPEQSMKQELSKLSFEQLQELQNKVGLKLYNQLVDGGKRPGSCKEQKQCHRTRWV
ncbi:ribosomal RNA processing protein 36 homolog [Chiloscyllium plagiosum]|uniref:ribosomal RNA processing protein 36 homolog n=1 Tax=Chiloscyllium plagiosum TaxID=36176 RepID=UPI001CB874C0|nr:ribosomal RNA processing protein 36 homolog [Chiloscyllium plagiosum]